MFGQNPVQRTFQENQLLNPLHSVRDGSEALTYLHGASVRPGLILLDVAATAAVEHLRVLKNASESKTIPVVVLAASNEERDLVESYDLGVAGYVVKPADPEALREAVSTVLLYWSLSETPGR